MEWARVFKLYNVRKQKSNLILYLFVMLSIIIAVSISLSIPQIIYKTNSYMTSQLEALNGADLKVVAPYISKELDHKLDEWKSKGAEINKFTVIAVNINDGPNKIFSSLIIGDYGLQEGEIILSRAVADEIDVKAEDTIVIGSRTFKVKSIENTANGVDSQSEMVGYGKVSSYSLKNEVPYTNIIMINGENSEGMKEELARLEPDNTYSTISDQQKTIQNQLDLNAATLNILNTMSCIMTILSVVSSIFMIIVHRQKDIAILRMISIRTQSIKRALALETFIMVLAPTLLGGLLSIPLAKSLVERNGAVYGQFDNELTGIIGSGFLLYLLVFTVFIHIALIAIEAISPLFVTRNDGVNWKKSQRKIVWLSVVFTFVTLFLYAMYLGRGSALLSSVVVFIFIIVFFVAIVVCAKLLTLIRTRSKVLLYGMKHIRSNLYSFVLVVLSLTLTIWFALIGFTLEKTIRDSYNSGIEKKINYQYMMVSDDPEQLEQEIKNATEVKGYTKLHRFSGTIGNDAITNKAIQICELDEEEYGVRYQILEGSDLFEGSRDGVLISAQLSSNTGLLVGQEISLEVNGEKKTYAVKGIYEDGGINSNFILMPTERVTPGGRILFQLQTDSSAFVNQLKDVSMMRISTIGVSIMNKVGTFLSVFKWLCLVSLFSSLLFNIIVVFLNFTNETKEMAIIRAIGLGKGLLYKSQALKFMITLLLSMVMSLGMYSMMLRVALNAVFKVSLNLDAATILLPIGFSLLLILVIIAVPFILIKNSNGYEELRVQV